MTIYREASLSSIVGKGLISKESRQAAINQKLGEIFYFRLPVAKRMLPNPIAIQ